MQNSSENQSNIDTKSLENSVKKLTIVGYQSRKYDQTVRPFKNLPLNRNLLALKDRMNYAEFFCMIQLWDWFQSTEIKVNDFRFTTSRAHLAEVAGVSEEVAKHTLQKLKAVKALMAVSTKFGVSEYVWNCGFLFRGVTKKHPAPDYKTTGPCMEFNRPLTKNHPASIICTLILPYYLPFYTALSGHKKNVDNSAPVSIGEIKDALRAGFPKETLKDALRAGLPIRKVVGLADGILNTWLGADLGGSHFLHDIFILIQSNQVDLYETEDFTKVLNYLLKGEEHIYKARKKIPNYFESEESLFEHYLTRWEEEKP